MTHLASPASSTTASLPSGDATAQSGRKFPLGLARLAFTEFWERFSFYGLQGVLIFYLLYKVTDGGLALQPTVAASIVGAYGGLVYLAQILGSWMGDRLLAPKWMVFWGGVVITAGHIALSILPGYTGLAIGLGFIVLGTGALKTNITSIVGMLLEGDAKARDAGFSYFYMAINIGATAGGLATGFVQTEFGFHVAFLLAAVGMAAALIQYVFVLRQLPAAASIVGHPLPPREYWRPVLVIVALVTAITLAWTQGLLNEANLASATAIVVLSAATVLFLVMLRSKEVTRDEKTRVIGFIPIFVTSSLFFGLLFQVLSVFPILMSAGRVDLTIGAWSIPPIWVLLTGTIAAVLYTPVLARRWRSRDHLGPNTAGKFAAGLLQLALGHVIVLIAFLVGGDVVPLLPVVLAMIIIGASEVFVGPTGLSVATRIAPENFKSQLVAMIFLTLAAGSTFGGLLGQLSTQVSESTYFGIIIAVSGALGLLLYGFRGQINARLATGLPA